MPDTHKQESVLLQELRYIRAELQQLNKHRLLVVNNSLKRALFFAMLKGIATGFGTVLGATLIVSWFVYLLSHIEFIPIIGDWVRIILEEVQGGKPG